MKRHLVIGSALVALLASLGVGQMLLEKRVTAQTNGAVQAPRFEVDPMWPKPLPNHWLYGNVIGVGVDSRDHIYIIHRGEGNLNAKEIYATANPPRKSEAMQQLQTFQKMVCKGAAAARYADQCSQTQQLANKLGVPIQ